MQLQNLITHDDACDILEQLVMLNTGAQTAIMFKQLAKEHLDSGDARQAHFYLTCYLNLQKVAYNIMGEELTLD